MSGKKVIGNFEATRIVKGHRFQDKTENVTISGTYQTNTYSPGKLIFQTSPGNSTVRLPDALTVELGWELDVFISSSSTANLTVETFTGTPIVTLFAGESFRFQNIDNTTPAGNWYSVFKETSATSPEYPILPCAPGVAVNDAVYVDGAGVLQKALASSYGTARTVGIVAGKPTSTQAKLAQYGVLPGFAALTPGGAVFLSAGAAGLLVQSRPVLSGEVSVKVGVAVSATEIAVSVEPPVVLS